MSRTWPLSVTVARPTPQAPAVEGGFAHGGATVVVPRRAPASTVGRRRAFCSLDRRDRPAGADRRPHRHPVREPPRGGAGRPRRGAARGVAAAAGRPASATTWWPAPTSAGRPPARRGRSPRHGAGRRQRHAPHRRRRPLGSRRRRHEGRAGGDARAGGIDATPRRSTSPGCSTPARRSRRCTTACATCSSERPDLVQGDAAVLGEPTDGALEVGCQGSMRVRVTLRGARAHTARPWMGRNAAAPSRPAAGGTRRLRGAPAGARRLRVPRGDAGGVRRGRGRRQRRARPRHRDDQPPVRPRPDGGRGAGPRRGACSHRSSRRATTSRWSTWPTRRRRPWTTRCSRRCAIATTCEVRAKLGWTDVSRFAAAGIPAANFGPGDSTLAHTRDERVERASLDRVHVALAALLRDGV